MADVTATDPLSRILAKSNLQGDESATVGLTVMGLHRYLPDREQTAVGIRLPARAPLGAAHDGLTNAAARRVYRRDGLPPPNRAHRALGLPPLPSPLEQYDRADRVPILVYGTLHRVPSFELYWDSVWGAR